MNLKNIILFLVFLWLLIIFVSGFELIESNQWNINITSVVFGTIIMGDIDNDNRSDLVLTGCLGGGGQNCGNSISKIYLNNGTSFTESVAWQQNLTSIGHGSTAFGDIDNDGDLDLALSGCIAETNEICDYASVISKIYLNNGTSFTESVAWQQNLTGIWKGHISFGDINNDGRLDLAMVGGNNNGIVSSKIYINNGTSLIINNQWQSNLIGLWQGSLSFADVNNDGLLDIGITGRDSSSIKNTRLYLNNGSAFLENINWGQNLLAVDKSAMIFGDIDNDGDLDIILMGCCDYLRSYNNTGSTFTQLSDETDFNVGGLFDGSLGFGDYNNNGQLDFVVIGRESLRSRLFNNTGHGIFVRDSVAGSGIETDDFESAALAWNDLDNDGDLDLIITGYSNGNTNIQIKVYISNTSLTVNNTLPTTPITFSNSTLSNGDVFLSWGNGSDNQTPSNGLYYNLRVGSTSAGNQIVSGIYGGSSGGENRGGGPASGYFGNMMQRKNISLKASRFQVNTTYYWSVQTIDTGLAKSEWSAEKTFILTSDFIPPTITINAPWNNLVTNATSITFNATVVDDYNLTNVTLYGNWSGGWHSNTTNSSGINNTDYIFSVNLTEGTHLWGIRTCDNTANCIGTNQTFRIDITSPIVNLLTPTNGSSWTTANVVNFTYNVSDLGINNCSLMINGLANVTNTSILVNQIQNFTTNLPNGNYNWSIRCTDQANNVNFTGNYTITVSYTASSGDTGGSTSSGGSSGGGSGGAGLSTTTSLTETSIISSVTANTPVEVKLAKAASIGIESILLTPTENTLNVKVIVSKLVTPPNGTISVDSEVLSYLEIKAEALENKLSQAVINFQVNKSLLNEKNIPVNDIILKRYVNGEWTDLETELISDNGTKAYYKATSPGLSYFAITSKIIAKKELVEENNILLENITKGNIKQENLEKKEIEPRPLNYKLIGFVTAAFLLSVLTFLILKKKPKIIKKQK